MNLGTYLERNRISAVRFADDLDLSVQAVYRYIAGHRIPRPSIMQKIRVATGGQVTPNDWFPPAESLKSKPPEPELGGGYVSGGQA